MRSRAPLLHTTGQLIVENIRPSRMGTLLAFSLVLNGPVSGAARKQLIFVLQVCVCIMSYQIFISVTACST